MVYTSVFCDSALLSQNTTFGLHWEVGLLTVRRARHITSPSERSEIADNGHRAKLPENPANISLSGQNDM
jgi:hypothetical protein